MATITHTDYLLAAGVPGLWVRLRNNDSGTDYYATAITDALGAYTHSAPPGDYSLYWGTAATVPGTPNLRSSHYSVPVTAGDDIVVGSATAKSSSSYTPSSFIGPGMVFGQVHDKGGVEWDIREYASITASTDIGPLINSAIADANAAGGGRVKIPVPPTSAGFQLATTILPQSNVEIESGFATLITWVGTTNNFMVASNPTAGNNVTRFGMRNLILDAGKISGTCPILLNSWQYGFLENLTLQNVSGSGTAALRMETALGTGSQNNTVGNRIQRLHIVDVPIGIQFFGAAGGTVVTNNWFDHVYMGGGSSGILGPTQIGVNMVQNCDSNMFSYVECILNGDNAIGVIFNNTGTPAASAGVFNERFYHLDISVFGGHINCTGVKLNYASQVFIEDLYHSPIAFPGTLIDATNFNPALNSAWIVNAQEPTTNHMDVIGSNIKWDTTGTFPLAPANSLQFGSSAAAGSPSLTAWGSDTNISVNVQGKGTGVVYLASQNHNFVSASGGLTATTPTVSALGDTNTSLGLQGTGTGVVYVASHRTNFLSLQGANTGGAATVQATGGDTNVNLNLQGQGTGGLVFTSKVVNYTGTATQGYGVPAIYQAPAPLTGQTAAVASVATITSANDALKHTYMVSGFVTITTLGSGSFNLQVAYTDSNGTARTCNIPLAAQAGTFGALANTADDYKGTVEITVNPNTAVTIKTAGTFTGCTYNVGGNIKQVL